MTVIDNADGDMPSARTIDSWIDMDSHSQTTALCVAGHELAMPGRGCE